MIGSSLYWTIVWVPLPWNSEPVLFTDRMNIGHWLFYTLFDIVCFIAKLCWTVHGKLLRLGRGTIHGRQCDHRGNYWIASTWTPRGIKVRKSAFVFFFFTRYENRTLVLTASLFLPYRKVFGNIDFLGAPREMRSEEQLKVISEEYEDISFVILSDVWLDQPKVTPTILFMRVCHRNRREPPLILSLLWSNYFRPLQPCGPFLRDTQTRLCHWLLFSVAISSRIRSFTMDSSRDNIGRVLTPWPNSLPSSRPWQPQVILSLSQDRMILGVVVFYPAPKFRIFIRLRWDLLSNEPSLLPTRAGKQSGRPFLLSR